MKYILLVEIKNRLFINPQHPSDPVFLSSKMDNICRDSEDIWNTISNEATIVVVLESVYDTEE